MNLLTTAPSFGPKHLSGLFLITILFVSIYYILKYRKLDEKKTLLLFLLAFYYLEFAKIFYFIYRDGSYPMNHLPLHLCSLPLYVYPILFFVKKDSKIYKYAKAAGFGPVIAAGIIAFAIPVNIIGEPGWLPLEDNFLPIVSFLYHGLMIFVPFYMLKMGYYKFKLSDSLNAMIFTLGLMILAIIANIALDKDFMLLNKGNGSPFQFLIDTSQILYTFTMIILGFIGVTLPFIVTAGIYKIKDLLKK